MFPAPKASALPGRRIKQTAISSSHEPRGMENDGMAN